jgi:xylono-1,5-lactonase
MQSKATCLWDLGAELGEGPVWHQEKLWFVDIKGPSVHCFDPSTGAKQSWAAPSPIGFVLPTVDGDFVAGLKTGLHRFEPKDGSFTLMAKVESADLDNRLNDGAVDSTGHLWFGSMHDPEKNRSGALYRLDSNREILHKDAGYIVTNGPAFSPDGKILYHTDTIDQTIYAFDLGTHGGVTNKRIFVRIETQGVYPDGLIVDAEGCVWTGLFGGWGMRRYAPSGELRSSISLPCSRATKGVIGGADGKTMFITTAWLNLSPEQRADEPLAGGIFAVPVDVPGLPTTLIRCGLSKLA